jgi:hypothetical protein
MPVGLSTQEYRNLIRNIGHLSGGFFRSLPTDAIAGYLSSNLWFSERLIDVLGVKHQKISAYFVLTNQRMICIAPEMKLLEVLLEDVQAVVTSISGFRVLLESGEFKAYYLHPKSRLDFPHSLELASIRTENTAPTLDASRKTGTAKHVGAILAILGAIVAFNGFQMDTTVSSEFGSVHNIGLMQEQNKQLQLGGIVFIAGVVLYCLGGKSNS